jgi:hypothetical protein
MQLDEVEYSTPHTIANAFLSYFEKNFSSPSMTDFQFNNPPNNNYIHLPSISTDDILRHLLKLKPSSASGDDALPGFILKDCAQILVTPLHFLYNLILTTSVYPCLWKVGKICPIFKSGKKNIISNQWRLVRGGRYGSADPEIYLKRTQFKTVHLYFFFKQVSSFISL